MYDVSPNTTIPTVTFPYFAESTLKSAIRR